MNPAYTVAFVQSVQDVANKVLDMPVEVGKPKLHDGLSSGYDVSAIIGLSGEVSGFVAISLSQATAADLVGRFIGMEISADDPDFADGIGEIANMIAGSAKARFAADRMISISCPSVVIGTNHKMAQQGDAPVIELPIQTSCGELVIIAVIKESEVGSASAAG